MFWGLEHSGENSISFPVVQTLIMGNGYEGYGNSKVYSDRRLLFKYNFSSTHSCHKLKDNSGRIKNRISIGHFFLPILHYQKEGFLKEWIELDGCPCIHWKYSYAEGQKFVLRAYRTNPLSDSMHPYIHINCTNRINTTWEGNVVQEDKLLGMWREMCWNKCPVICGSLFMVHIMGKQTQKWWDDVLSVNMFPSSCVTPETNINPNLFSSLFSVYAPMWVQCLICWCLFLQMGSSKDHVCDSVLKGISSSLNNYASIIHSDVQSDI